MYMSLIISYSGLKGQVKKDFVRLLFKNYLYRSRLSLVFNHTSLRTLHKQYIIYRFNCYLSKLNAFKHKFTSLWFVIEQVPILAVSPSHPPMYKVVARLALYSVHVT